MYKPHTQICVLVFLLLIATSQYATSLHAQETIILSQDPIVLESARKTIKAYGIEPTVAATHKLLSDLVSSIEDDTELHTLIANLDSDKYALREAAEEGLVAKGAKASGLLKNAIETASPEARVRAARCLKRISNEWLSIQQAAIHVFAGDDSTDFSSTKRLELLIRLGKEFPEPQLQSTIATAIVKNADTSSRDAVIAGLRSDQTIIRRACVFGLPNCIPLHELSKFKSLLTDSDDNVAFTAIVSFGKHFRKTSVTHLTDNLLTSDQSDIRLLAHWMLQLISDEDFGYLEHENKTKRDVAIAKWQAWAKNLSPDQPLDFSKLSLPNQSRPIGFVASVNGSAATILDIEGNVVRKVETSLYDAQAYPGHRLLVCERNDGIVRLLDQKNGKSLRTVEGLSQPTDAELLNNGNILVLQGNGIATEHDTNGAIIRSFTGLNNSFDIDRLRNGNTIVADSGNNRLVEFSPNGKVVWEKTDLAFPNNVFRMADNRTLYTTYSSGEVVMLGTDGKEQWRTSLENGTLYSVFCGGGEIYVSDGGNQKIWVLGMDGKQRRAINVGLSFCDVGFITK